MQPRIPAPPLWRTARDFADVAHPRYWLAPAPDPDLPRGDGHAVLFLPGMACADYITAPARKFYRALGYDTHGWGMGFNLGPFPSTMQALRKRLFELSDRSGRRVTLIGKSLGGFIARELAKAHPERVRRLILVCVPVKHPIANRAAPLMYALKPLFDSGISRDLDILSQPAPVPTTALYTKRDGLIGWPCCLEEPSALAENIELADAYHTTAQTNPQALRIVAEKLALPERPN